MHISPHLWQVATKRLLHQQVKILLRCSWKCIATNICSGVDISEVHGCHLFRRMSSQRRSQKLLQGLLVSHELTAYLPVFDIFLTQWIMSIINKPDNFELHSSQKFIFLNICGLPLNFVECDSLPESNSPYILALCETSLDDRVDFGNFSVTGYLPLIWKDSITHMHGLAIYVKEGLSFTPDFSLENSVDSYLYFWLALLRAVFCFFFLYRPPSLSLCMVWF